MAKQSNGYADTLLEHATKVLSSIQRMNHSMCMLMQTLPETGIKEEAPDDADTARSRSAFVIMYAGCPILWGSKLQTLIALSSTESEYFCLSTATREVIPIMELAKEMKQYGFDIGTTAPTVHCKVFEDNSGALEIATVHKVRPRTKHINVQYHHFRQYVNSGQMSIQPIDTDEQPADMLSKSVPWKKLAKHRLFISGW